MAGVFHVIMFPCSRETKSAGRADRLTPKPMPFMGGREVRDMQSKATEVITIRTTVTTTVKIESTTMPLIIVVLKDSKG